MKKVRCTHIEIKYPRVKKQRGTYKTSFSDLPPDIIPLIIGYLTDEKDLNRAISISQVWVAPSRIQFEKVVAKMSWSIFIFSEYMTVKVIALLGKCPKICATEYAFRHNGMGGNTAIMIHRSLTGMSVRAVADGNFSLPPTLTTAGSGRGHEIIPVTRSTIGYYLDKPSNMDTSLESHEEWEHSMEYSVEE
jgi:hypothetical protein